MKGEMQDLNVSRDGRHLVLEDGTPFFWLGDTAWELLHRLSLDETELYLRTRRNQGFNVIQTVALAELDGLRIPNANGDVPFLSLDTLEPNEAYFAHVDKVLELAGQYGLYVALLPTWGDKLLEPGAGPKIFAPDYEDQGAEAAKQRACRYGEWLGARYKDLPHLIWVLGGDRDLDDERDPDGILRNVVRSLVKGLKQGDGGRHLMTYHVCRSSSLYFHSESWLDFNMSGSYHFAYDQETCYQYTERDYALKPVKPTLDAEPRYEDHPVNWDPSNGYFDDFDVRQSAYWSVFAGACGHTYGCHGVWQMFDTGRKPECHPRADWRTALGLPGAQQMKHLRRLMESRGIAGRKPNNEVLVDPLYGGDRMLALQGEGYLWVYTPKGRDVELRLGRLPEAYRHAGWFSPRDGRIQPIEWNPKDGTAKLQPPASGRGQDWVLLLDMNSLETIGSIEQHRVLIHHHPFEAYEEREASAKLPWEPADAWPCKWISGPDEWKTPFVTAYRIRFAAVTEELVRIHVSADERYELYLDGERIGRGSERGPALSWFYETYRLHLGAGEHVLVARTWSLGELAPWAQSSVYPGFLLAPDTEEWQRAIGTGIAPWQVLKLEGYEFKETPGLGIGAKLVVDGARFPWGVERGAGEVWMPAVSRKSGNNGYVAQVSAKPRVMFPAQLPPMLEAPIRHLSVRYVGTVAVAGNPAEEPLSSDLAFPNEIEGWDAWANGLAPLTLPPGSVRRAIIDLNNYYCLYPTLVSTGGKGAEIRLHWAEALYRREEESYVKRNRNDVEGCWFRGVGDTFKLEGGTGRVWNTLWWHAGRYTEVMIRTEEEELILEPLQLRETRYPLEAESRFACSDERLNRFVPMAVRSLQMCAHETYMDCPYWEQLMYVGDTRLETLMTYALSRDGGLPRKALHMFDVSRTNYTGLAACAFPDESGKIIPSFSLFWVAMIHDYAMWKGDSEFVRNLMPGMRNNLDLLLLHLNDDLLLRQPRGWPFMDGISAWRGGNPPDGGEGVNATYHWLAVYTLKRAAQLELYAGVPELAQRYEVLAIRMAAAGHSAFWHEERRLYADDRTHESFSEHTQCLAILSGMLDRDRKRQLAGSLKERPTLTQTSIYFSHYLFETYAELGLMDLLFERLEDWFGLQARGFTCTPEHFDDGTRSDCHAWGAHPVYHFMTALLGIRPDSMAFRTVRIEPRLGPLSWVKGRMVHPLGVIEAEFRKTEDGSLSGEITLPEGVIGIACLNGEAVALVPGRQCVGRHA